ncbi:MULTISPECIES: bile acid:sodium symporter family protein [Sphingobium]|uniref:bile acid:sodium symporter family protein n=1 Tax=Sphingobium TaxID=165695 RepID=UPI00159CC0E8|nr:bile acid:sodium symporter family protein [Sphingobium sp. 15-1]
MQKILRFLDPYIGLMIATVALAALLPARGMGAQIAGAVADGGIVLLFFLYGVRISPQAALDGMTNWRLQLAVLGCTFLLFPALGLIVYKLAPPGLSGALRTGILFLCLLPSTVQSSIAFTSIARGNVPAALCAASASNILGVFISPLLAGWLLQHGGVALSFDNILDIVLQLLAPFAAGQALRPWIGKWVQDHKAILGYVDRGSILLIIYVAFSKGMVDNIWTDIGLTDMALLSSILAGLLAAALGLTYAFGRKLMRLGVEDEIVLQFCGSKKSLASGLPMATVLFSGPQLGLIVLPLMLFHQLQLIVCAVLARHYGARATSR